MSETNLRTLVEVEVGYMSELDWSKVVQMIRGVNSPSQYSIILLARYCARKVIKEGCN